MSMKLKTKGLMKLQANEASRGFTLIEIMVAVSIFAIVAVIATGALVTASNVNRKAQAIKTAIDNLNFAIDSMVLNLGDGSKYHCITSGNVNPNWLPTYNDTNTCVDGGEAIAFNFGTCSGPGTSCDKVIYNYNNIDGSIQAWRQSSGGSFVEVTAPEVKIDNFKVYVYGIGTEASRALLVIGGHVNDNTNTAFNLETTIYARL